MPRRDCIPLTVVLLLMWASFLLGAVGGYGWGLRLGEAGMARVSAQWQKACK